MADDTIDDIAARLVAKRAANLVRARELQAQRDRAEAVKDSTPAAQKQLWDAVEARIDDFLTGLNAKLLAADIRISFAPIEQAPGDRIVAQYRARFDRSSQGVDHRIGTVFHAGIDGVTRIYISNPDDEHPLATFEFRTETISEAQIETVFSHFLKLGEIQ
ncbi:hypothetical protein G4G27_14385 [Sphingomonas sp. So64.6b]|uniref:hypothetical protein n=1 Tax=Sphingomonas sp. So64.6b TaxID=2997354 RepID=UPI00160301E0|nr:hypothetical protein [Sphingomonas sp. So64.6b]QNA85051.1 hypothetical protein G4G27_14385 [Sphingomonas sp. So64.6b]